MAAPPSPLVFITGASSGIGQALARRYAQDGWRLALVARRTEALQAWAAAQRLDPSRCLVLGADVRDPAALAAAAQACLAAAGLPDVVIANAGISIGFDTADAADLEVMRDTLLTNVLGIAATFQPFLAAMRERRSGTLVGVASVAGLRGIPGHGAYSASKAAAIAYCESLRVECRGQGVRVVTLAPGYIDTPMTRRNRHSMPFRISADAFAQRAVRAIAAGTRWRVIPWPMALVVPLLRALPRAWFDALLANRPHKPRRGEPAN